MINLYHDAFAALAVPAAIVDRQGHIAVVNPARAEQLSRRPDELVGLSPAAAGLSTDQILCRPLPGGGSILTLARESHLLAETQRRLADSERRFRAIFDHTYEFIGLLDVDGRLLEANATALTFIGKRLEEIVGQHFADTPWWTHSDEDRAMLRAGLKKAAKGEFVRFETTHPGTGGEVINIDFSLKPVQDDAGAVVYIIPEGRDISAIKHTEAALRAAKLEAEAANHAKSAFLAAISHELRTPLNAVLGFSETIQNEVFGPLGNARYAEYVDLIHNAGSHLRDIIEDILDVTRIEIGEVTLNEETFEVGDCLRSLTRMLAASAEQRHIALDLEIPDLPRLHADPLRVRQIMLNLIGNAIKFTEPQGRVSVRTTADDDGLRLEVADTGIGIRPEDMDNIWKPFFQAEGSLARRFGGTGLGLPIVRHYVEAHGGTITVASTPGQGATFTVRMPAGRLVRPANQSIPVCSYSAAG
jgi:PAS domain S-box-containing protein